MTKEKGNTPIYIYIARDDCGKKRNEKTETGVK